MKTEKNQEKKPQLAEFLHQWRNHTQTTYEDIYQSGHLRKSTFTEVKRTGYHPKLTLQHVANMANYLRSLLTSQEEMDRLARELGYALMGDRPPQL